MGRMIGKWERRAPNLTVWAIVSTQSGEKLGESRWFQERLSAYYFKGY